MISTHLDIYQIGKDLPKIFAENKKKHVLRFGHGLWALGLENVMHQAVMGNV